LITHDELRALCALSTSGSLTAEENSRLEEHLLVCLECRKTAQEYDRVARTVMPSLVTDFPADVGQLPEWSEEKSKRELFRELDLRKQPDGARSRLFGLGRGGYAKHPVTRGWRDSLAWLHHASGTLAYAAACVVLSALIGMFGYRLGEKRGANPFPVSQLAANDVKGRQDGIAAMSQERQLLRAQLQEQDRTIASFTAKAAHQLAEIQELKNEDRRAQDSYLRAQEDSVQTASEREALRRKLEQAQSDLALMQADVESLRRQRASDAARVAELETRLGQVPELLKDRDTTIEQQRDLLARDRDIRDLMGARDLYIAEVFDVGRDGETKKPFGRVFYTKGKSLIFYAYDLDQQPGLREASTFQAWGRRGPDVAQAMNLGIFYVDNTTHRRWVLKFDDPKSLDQIDAVFVTVEPKGGSRKPSGKQLLFAYLRVEPNHP
jgi:hypothetical protein